MLILLTDRANSNHLKNIYPISFFKRIKSEYLPFFVSQKMSDNSGDSSPPNAPQPDDAAHPSPVSPLSSSSSDGIEVIRDVSTERWLDENRLGNTSDSSAGPDLNLENIPGTSGSSGLKRPTCAVPRVDFWKTRDLKSDQARFSRQCRRRNRETRARVIAEQRRRVVQTARARPAPANIVAAPNSNSDSSTGSEVPEPTVES